MICAVLSVGHLAQHWYYRGRMVNHQSVQNGQFLSSLVQKASHLLVASHADKRIELLFVHVVVTAPAKRFVMHQARLEFEQSRFDPFAIPGIGQQRDQKAELPKVAGVLITCPSSLPTEFLEMNAPEIASTELLYGVLEQGRHRHCR
jgi:hypothetical protein